MYDSDDSFEEEEEPEQNDEEADIDSMLSYSTEKSAELRPSLSASRYEGEHADPMSYAWCLMRYAIVQLAIKHVHELLQLVQLEHGGEFGCLRFDFEIRR